MASSRPLATMVLAGVLAALPAAGPVRAVSFDQVARELALSTDERAQLASGAAVTREVKASNARELAVGLAIRIPGPPAALASSLLEGLALQEDPDILERGPIRTASLADFAGVHIDADTARTYLAAAPGSALNLSTAEIAVFHGLAGQPAAQTDPVGAVEPALREQLLGRYRAYRAKGLAGIAPYARGGSKETRPGEDLAAATSASRLFTRYAPGMAHVLATYPASRPPELVEQFRWLRYRAHGTEPFVLAQYLSLQDGSAWSVAARQFYVSTSYNAEQNIALLLPTDDGATIAVQLGRVSTDQVTGFGSSARRSIGSRLMADTLAKLAEAVAGARGKQ
jgi:hypothetical protein